MRIGEIADRAGLSTKALRYYERVGLIDAPTRAPSGYRDYPPSVLDRLRFIRSAQAVGLTLGEIKGARRRRREGNPRRPAWFRRTITLWIQTLWRRSSAPMTPLSSETR